MVKVWYPLINGNNEEFKDRIVITNSQRTEIPEPWRRTSLMQANWRLINGTELYDLDTDPEQRTNVADQYPEKMQELKAAYETWWDGSHQATATATYNYWT